MIRDIARENIQQAQSSQKRQYDKTSRPVSIEVEDTVFVKTQPKFKLDRNFHGPFRVYEVTSTNVKVKYINQLLIQMLSLEQSLYSKCPNVRQFSHKPVLAWP